MLLTRLTLLATALGAASASFLPISSLQPRATSSNIAVDGSARYTGACSSSVCSWKGVRYAQAPTGALRFAPARAPSPAPSGTIDATRFGAICLQSSSAAQSEDCLFANVYRPANVALSTKLPVLLFVHGGGFQSGSGSAQDATAMVAAGSSSSLPAVVVTINYRLGLFGFLGGTVFSNRQSTNRNDVTLNAALTDVRQALKWLKAHVSAFGGDPAKITLWGQSAGSFASAAQMLGSTSSPDFIGVILESGSPGGVPVDRPTAKDAQFNSVAGSANCAGASDKVACLRSASAADLKSISVSLANANGNDATTPRGYYAWTMMQDGGPSNGGFYADRPSVLINAGRFAAVPVLHGDDYDEGTYFATQKSTSDAYTADYFNRIYFSGRTDLVNRALQLYPDVPAVGSPYKPASGNYNDRYYGATNQYKRVASLYGDIRYQSNRRLFLTAVVNKGQRAYSYEFAQKVSGTADAVGYPHGSDVNFVFNTQSGNPFGTALARQWLSFATYQTPNKANVAQHWYQYSASAPQRIMYYANSTMTTVNDDFRAAPIAFLNSADVLAVTGR